MTQSEREKIVRLWYESRNCGKLAKVGPVGYDKNGDHGSEAVCSTWEHDRVNAALGSIGRGMYAPTALADLLDHLYGRGDPIDAYHLFLPGKGLSTEMIGLGFRVPVLIDFALARFWAALDAAVEAQPKPEVREFETA